MERAEFDQLVESGSDEELLDAIWEDLPEGEDADGKFDGDLIQVTQYASAEICNGGFFQFYGNNIFNPDRLIECFETLGVSILAQCVRDSKAKFPEGKPPVRTKEREPIDSQLTALGIDSKTFDDIEDVYYANVDSLYNSWAPHVRRNPDVYFEYVK